MLEKVIPIDDSIADYQVLSPQEMPQIDFKEMKEFPDTLKTGRPGKVKEIDLRKLQYGFPSQKSYNKLFMYDEKLVKSIDKQLKRRRSS